MDDFEIIVPGMDPANAKAELQTWLARHPHIQDRIGREDLMLETIYAGPGKTKHQYRIRKTLIYGEYNEPNKSDDIN